MRRSGSAIPASAAIALIAAVGLATAASGSGGAVPTPPSGAELEALAQPQRVAAVASQRVYFVMPDRYANGDPSNDRGAAAGSRAQHGFDPTDTGYFHGGDLKGLTGGCTDPKTGLQRIRDLGFTALWVTPPVVQRAVQGSSAAYHGYWGVDFTRVDPHLGTNDDFGALVTCAHSLGIKVYLDVVANHTADVISLTGAGYSEAPYRTCSGRVFDPARYAGTGRFPCVKAETMPRTPIVLRSDRRAKRPLWLNDVRRYHNRGDIAFASCSEECFEQGDFFGLDDLFTEQPAVVKGLAAVYGDWVRRYALDGFRVDTAKHVDRAFFKVWTPRIRAAARAAGVADFEIFGEVFVGDAVELSRYPRERSVPNVIDFPLADALVRYAGGSASARGIAARLDDDDYFNLPAGVMHTPTTFLGNHDVGRAARLIADQSGASGTELLRRVLLGHSLLYLLRGAPVVMYGDEVGIIGRGGDKEARQDLFPTKVREWQREDRVGAPPIGTGSSFDVADHPVGLHLRALGALRDAHPALSSGATAVRSAAQGVLVLSRFDAVARREYLAAFNAQRKAATVTVPTATPGAAWAPLVGTGAPVSSGADGRVTLAIPALGAVLLRADTDLPRRSATGARLRVSPDDFSALHRLQVSVAGVDPASVTVAIRRGGDTSWRRLAVDASPPYRAFVDLRRYRKGERVHFVAVVRSSSGDVATSPIVAYEVLR